MNPIDRTNHNYSLTRRTVLQASAAGLTIPAISGVATAAETRKVVDFNEEGPENLALDDDGNIYMTMNFSGDILKLPVEDATMTDQEPDVTERITSLDTGGGFIVGIVADDSTLYVALASFSDPGHGIWKITQNGSVDSDVFAALPLNGLPNGILHDTSANQLLVTDSFLGKIYRISLPDGAVSDWIDNDLLNPSTFIGANGITMDKEGDVYVANLDHGRIVRIPVDNGSAGEPEKFVDDTSELIGADGLTFHKGTMLYVAVNGQDKVVKINPAKEIRTVVNGESGLDFPADVAFGATKQTHGKLYIANFGLNPDTLAIDGDTSLMRTHP